MSGVIGATRMTVPSRNSATFDDTVVWDLVDAGQVINCDSRSLSLVPDESVHLVITSPPYNVGIDYEKHDDMMSVEDYLDLLRDVWDECERVLVPGGRICVNVPAGVGRSPYVPILDKVLDTLESFSLRGVIVWDKGTSGGRTTWGSYRLPTNPTIRDTTERIIVAHKGLPGTRLEIPSELKSRDEKGVYSPFLEDGALFRELTQDHWIMSPESKSRVGHPAPFPVQLPERLIRLYGYPGATILDPFAGSGSTGVAVMRLNKTYSCKCNAILVDKDYGYCQIAVKRCLDEYDRRKLSS